MYRKLNRLYLIEMLEIADIDVMIYTYLNVQDISNLLRVSCKIYRASRAHIVIEKAIREHSYSDTKLYTRKVLDKYENCTFTDGIKYTVNDFGYVRLTSFDGSPRRYVVYIDKYCHAKAIFGYNSSDWSLIHEFTIAFEWMDIFSLYHLHYLYGYPYRRNNVKFVRIHWSNYNSAGNLGDFTDRLRENNMSLDMFLRAYTGQKVIDFIRNL